MQAIIFWGGLALLLIGIFYVLIPLILWKQRKHIQNLEKEITFLHHQIKHISNKLDSNWQNNITNDSSHEFNDDKKLKEPEIETNLINEPNRDASPAPALSISYSIEHEINPDSINDEAVSDSSPSLSEAFDETKPTDPIAKPSKKNKKITFEQQFGARLPVWIGGIALALAGFFLVKYSIEHNLITPEIRVFMGVVFGIGLLYISQKIIAKETIANGTRIAQSLAGSGIAILYLSAYAATKLYHFVPTFVGFLSMGMITLTALILCLRYGTPIGLLGMAGGFLTPALLSTEDGNAMTLFIYLYFTASGLLIVVRKTKVWWLSIPTILLSLGWVIVCLFSNRYTPEDSIWLILFLVGVSATIITNSNDQFASDRTSSIKHNGMFTFTSILNYIGLGGTLVMMGLIAGKSGFGAMEWSLFCLLAFASVVLAYFNRQLYGFVPWIALAVNCVMLMLWDYDRTLMFMTILSLLSIIYIAPSYYCIIKGRSPLHWAGILSAASLAFFMIAYYNITDAQTPLPFGFVWGTFALIATFAMVHLVFIIHEMDLQNTLREKLYAVFCVAATSFLSIGLFIECAHEFLSLAFAAQILALSWINSKVSVKSLRPICMVLSIIFALLLTPQILLMLQLTIYSLFEARVYVQSEVPIVSYPVIQLGLPALMMVTASYYLRKQHDGTFIYWLESAFIIMIAATGYYFMRNLMHPNQNVLFIKANFIERGILTNALLVYAIMCLWSGRIFKRLIFSWGGVLLTFAGAFRILYFDLFLYNPLFEYTEIKGPVIANSFFITYALPALWLYYVQKELQHVRFISFFNTGIGLIYLSAFAGIILFAWLNLNIRYMFHDHSLTLKHNTTTNMEIYTYSAAWLVVGIGVLFAGLLRQNKVLRLISLTIIVITVGKVFLYDASALEGLYRVISFLGLGICLIGLSYFYSRFVFSDTKNERNE